MADTIDDGDDRRSGLLRTALTIGVPVWAVLVVFAIAAGALAWVWIARDAVPFGPAVSRAQQVRAEVTMCNEVVDAEEINPREAELTFEQALRSSGVRDADVTVHRRDCDRAG